MDRACVTGVVVVWIDLYVAPAVTRHTRKAQAVFAVYILSGGPRNILKGVAVRAEINASVPSYFIATAHNRLYAFCTVNSEIGYRKKFETIRGRGRPTAPL